jgi:hypothetical protein
VFKKFSLAVVAVAVMTGSAMANDLLDSAGFDLAAISDANNVVLEANLDVDVDTLASEVGDEEAVEACFRRFGGWRGHYGFGCYNPCFYHRPVYFCQPVYYTTYTYCHYPLYHWGCHY